MSNDKTLATVKHGGCVQLAASERARFEAFLSGNPLMGLMAGTAWQVWQAALSAQPSPGGQGDALAAIDRLLAHVESLGASQIHPDYVQDARTARAALAARQPVGSEEAHILPPLATESMLDAGWPCGEVIDRTFDRQGAYADLVAAAPAIARQPVGEPLWCMHILGPDDVHAAPSKAHAEKAAAAVNWFHAARDEQSEHDPKVEAVVAPWPHSAESHAESVADFIPEWMLPRWQVEAIQTNAAPPAQQPAQVYLDGLDRALGEAIGQRDRYHEVADDLAGHIAAITGVDIGEHSSANCPWQNAIEAAEEYKPAQAVELGKFREAVEMAMEVPLNSVQRQSLQRLLALIDGKAVGK